MGNNKNNKTIKNTFVGRVDPFLSLSNNATLLFNLSKAKPVATKGNLDFDLTKTGYVSWLDPSTSPVSMLYKTGQLLKAELVLRNRAKKWQNDYLNLIADELYIEKTRDKYNKRKSDDLLLHDLSLDFYSELDNAREYYNKSDLTIGEIEEWFNGKKYFGKKLRDEEQEILPGVYVWHGRAFTGDYRIPVPDKGIKISTSDGEIQVDLQGVVNKKRTDFFGRLLEGLSSDPDDKYLPLMLSDLEHRKKTEEWANYVKSTYSKYKGILSSNDFLGILDLLMNNNMSNRAKSAMNSIINSSNYWKETDKNSPINRNARNLKLLLLDRYKFSRGTTIIEGIRELHLLELETLLNNKEITKLQYEEFKKQQDELIKLLSEMCPDDAALYEMYLDGLSREGLFVKAIVNDAILKNYNNNLILERKALTRSLNNVGKTTQLDFGSVLRMSNGDIRKELNRRKNSEDTLYMTDSAPYNYAGPAETAVDRIQEIDDTLREITNGSTLVAYEGIKNDTLRLKALAESGDLIAKTMPGYTGDSDDILHSILEEHNIDAPWGKLDDDLRIRALALIALDELSIRSFNISEKEVLLQMHNNMLHYRYAALSALEWVGATAWGTIASYGGTLALIGGLLLSFVLRPFYDSFADAYVNSWLAQWGHNFSATGITGFEGLFKNGFSLLEGLRLAQEGRAFTKEEIEGYIKAEAVTDPDMIKAMREGTFRTGGGETQGILLSESENLQNAGGSFLLGSSLFVSNMITMFGQMKAVQTATKALSSLGGGLYKAGLWVLRAHNVLDTGSKFRLNMQNFIGGSLKMAGNLQTASAPYLSAAGLNSGYIMSSYLNHIQEAQGKVFTNLRDLLLATPTDEFKAMVDSNEENRYGGMNDKQYTAYLSQVSERELDRLIDEIEGGLWGTKFLIDKTLSDKNDPLSANFSSKNIDINAVKKYVDDKVAENKDYIYAMDQYMLAAKKAAESSANVEMLLVNAADGTAMKVLQPSMYMNASNRKAYEAFKRSTTNKMTKAFDKTISYLDNKGFKKISNGMGVVRERLIPSPLKLNAGNKNVKKVEVSKDGGVKVVANNEEAIKVLGKENWNNFKFGFASNFAQDLGVGVDSGLYNNDIANYIVQAYDPRTLTSFMSPASPYAGEGFFGECLAAGEGALLAATEWNSYRDGLLGGCAGFITPMVKFGDPKYIEKNLNVSLKVANMWHSVRNISVENPYTSWLKAKYLGAVRENTGLKFKWLGSDKTNLFKRIEDKELFKVAAAQRIEKILQLRGLGVLDSIIDLQKAVQEIHDKNEDQESEDMLFKSTLEHMGIKVSDPILSNLKDQLLLSELLLDLANADFVSAETGEIINDGKNPAAELYKLYINNKGKREKVTRQKVLRALEYTREYFQSDELFLKEFSYDPELLSIIEDLIQFSRTTKGGERAPLAYLHSLLNSEGSTPLKGSLTDVLDLAVLFVNDVSESALLLEEVIESYREAVDNSHLELGNLLVNDPIVIRAHARLLATMYILEKRVAKLKKERTNLIKTLESVRKSIKGSKKSLNEKEAITFLLIQQGFDVEKVKNQVADLEKEIGSINNLIDSHSLTEEALIKEIQDKYGKKEVTTEKEKKKKKGKEKGKKSEGELGPKKMSYYEAVLLLNKAIEDAKKEFLEKEKDPNNLEEDVTPSDSYYEALEILDKLNGVHSKIYNLQLYGVELLKDADGNLVVDINQLETLKDKKDRLSSLNDLKEALLKMKDGEKSKVLNDEKADNELELLEKVLTAELILEKLISNKFDGTFLEFLVLLLDQKQNIADGRSTDYDNSTMRKQVEELEKAFGENLLVIKDLIGSAININSANLLYEVTRDEIINTVRNKYSIDSFAARAKELGMVYMFSKGYENFASECKSYSEFIKLYNEENDRIDLELELNIEGKDEKEAAQARIQALYQKRGLDLALSNNKYFQEYDSRVSRLSTNSLFKAVNLFVENIEREVNDAEGSEIGRLKLELRDKTKHITELFNLEQGNILTILRNIVEYLALYSEEGLSNDMATIETTISKIQDNTEELSNKTIDSINKQLEAQHISVTTDTISKVVELLYTQFEIIKESERIARALSGEGRKVEEADNLDTELPAALEVGEGQPPVDSNQYISKKRYNTYMAQLASYSAIISDVNLMVSDIIDQYADKPHDKNYEELMQNVYQQLNGIIQVITHRNGWPGTKAEILTKEILEIPADYLNELSQIMETIVNTPYSENGKNVETLLEEATTRWADIHNDIDTVIVKFLDSLRSIVASKAEIPVLYDSTLETPLESEKRKQLEEAKNTVFISKKPFKLSTFYRQLLGGVMRTLMTNNRVDEYLAANYDSLVDKDVIFLYNLNALKALEDTVPSMKGYTDAAIVAVAVPDENGSVVIKTKDSAGKIVETRYQIIGFLPTSTNEKNLGANRDRNLNSAGNVRKHINRSLLKYKEEYDSTNDDWVPIYDFSSEKLGFMTTKVKSTEAVNALSHAKSQEETDEMNRENTKTTILRLKRGSKHMPNGIFSQKGVGVQINIGTKENPINIPLEVPSMDRVINSRGKKFGDITKLHKQQHDSKSAKAVITFNKNTIAFADQIKGLLLGAKHDPANPRLGAIISSLIQGKHPETGEILRYGIIDGYEHFHARNHNSVGVCLSNNIFSLGGHLYTCTVDGSKVSLYVVDRSGNLVDGTTVKFDLEDINDDGSTFKDSKEEIVDLAIADFISAISTIEEKGNKIAEFTYPKGSMLKDNPSNNEVENIEAAFNDGLIVIPKYDVSADVTLNYIAEDGVTEQINDEAERRALSLVNRNRRAKSLEDSTKISIINGINAIVKKFKGNKSHPATKFNLTQLMNEINFGASTENVDTEIESSKRSNNQIIAFMLGNIVDDMTKRIATNRKCSYDDYSSILTRDEFAYLNNMIKLGLDAFMTINQFTPLTAKSTSNNGILEALEVIVKDQKLIDELAKIGLDADNAPRNIMDLVMITPRGTLAIIDVKSHIGDLVATEHLSAYVNLLNMYAKLLNDAIKTYREGGGELPKLCIVDEIYLFEVPLSSRSDLNYNLNFDIRRFNREGDGKMMIEFNRKHNSTVKLVNENDSAHLSKYQLFSDEVMEQIIKDRRDSILSKFEEEKLREEKDKEEKKNKLVELYLGKKWALKNQNEEETLYATMEVTQENNQYKVVLTYANLTSKTETFTSKESLYDFLRASNSQFLIQKIIQEPIKTEELLPPDPSTEEQGGACAVELKTGPKESIKSSKINKAFDDMDE